MMTVTNEMVSAATQVVPSLSEATVRQILEAGMSKPRSGLPVVECRGKVSTAVVAQAKEDLEEVLENLWLMRKDLKKGQQDLLDAFAKDCERFIHNMLLAEGHPTELARRVEIELQRK